MEKDTHDEVRKQIEYATEPSPHPKVHPWRTAIRDRIIVEENGGSTLKELMGTLQCNGAVTEWSRGGCLAHARHRGTQTHAVDCVVEAPASASPQENLKEFLHRPRLAGRWPDSSPDHGRGQGGKRKETGSHNCNNVGQASVAP